MASISKNKYDVCNWIKKVISSVDTESYENNLRQRRCCIELIRNFYKLYKDAYLVQILKSEYDNNFDDYCPTVYVTSD